ncbi:MAG: aldo/keto reductase [Pyrinomonadaceae bacterium]
MAGKTTRRAFVVSGVAAAGAVAGGAALKLNNAHSTVPEHEQAVLSLPEAVMPERELGSTGVRLPIFGLGGAGQTPLDKKGKEKEAVQLVEAALTLGIRHFDTAASYGESEYHLGKILPTYRAKLFLSTKTDQRTRDGAWRELERSMKRLNTDHLDLWQLHHVSSEEDLRQIFAADGAIKALDEARKQKIVRFAGITGHHEPAIILEGLRRYEFSCNADPC